MSIRVLILLILSILSVATFAIEADEKPRWELGVAGGARYAPHYPASEEFSSRGIVVPYGIYRGDSLKVGDGSFIKGVLLDDDQVEFDFSFNGAFNADSADNDARKGMPDLDYLIEFGPSMTVKLREDNRSRFELGLPFRAVASTNFSNFKHRGYVFNPQLRYLRKRIFGSNTRIVSNLGLTYATEKLQDYFYSVDDAFVTADRAAYSAKGGYLGASFSLSLSYPIAEDIWLLWGSRLGYFKGARNADSPLFSEDTTITYSFGFAWRLAKSKDTVRSRSIR